MKICAQLDCYFSNFIRINNDKLWYVCWMNWCLNAVSYFLHFQWKAVAIPCFIYSHQPLHWNKQKKIQTLKNWRNFWTVLHIEFSKFVLMLHYYDTLFTLNKKLNVVNYNEKCNTYHTPYWVYVLKVGFTKVLRNQA